MPSSDENPQWSSDDAGPRPNRKNSSSKDKPHERVCRAFGKPGGINSHVRSGWGHYNLDVESAKINRVIKNLVDDLEDPHLNTEAEFRSWLQEVEEVQARHDKYMSEGDFILPANKRMAFLVDCVEAFKSEMLELTCAQCRRYSGDPACETCTPERSQSKTALSKCNLCRKRRIVCDWGKKIPLQLNQMKITIHAEMSARREHLAGVPALSEPSPSHSPIATRSRDRRNQPTVVATVPESPGDDFLVTIIRAMEVASTERQSLFEECLKHISAAFS